MIQKLEILITAGNDADHTLEMVALPSIEIKGYWRNEKDVARAMRKLAAEIETGTSFMGVRVNRPIAGC